MIWLIQNRKSLLLIIRDSTIYIVKNLFNFVINTFYNNRLLFLILWIISPIILYISSNIEYSIFNNLLSSKAYLYQIYLEYYIFVFVTLVYGPLIIKTPLTFKGLENLLDKLIIITICILVFKFLMIFIIVPLLLDGGLTLMMGGSGGSSQGPGQGSNSGGTGGNPGGNNGKRGYSSFFGVVVEGFNQYTEDRQRKRTRITLADILESNDTPAPASAPATAPATAPAPAPAPSSYDSHKLADWIVENGFVGKAINQTQLCVDPVKSRMRGLEHMSTIYCYMYDNYGFCKNTGRTLTPSKIAWLRELNANVPADFAEARRDRTDELMQRLKDKERDGY